ncbi:similar to polyphosphoinositide binding protein Ssh2 [Cyanidioschyzon merolae strain 10D]|uniref:Similar to polyphosphoinositide binding protein Ssh2 n=1 Tax=Cyanidioschyzon merolae (strain NIES-3377 / 10D) TaxID=280699 RepID=M1VA35_CYAM1|nr:similar to polyphosphoinositide binding protein Ssh2 [Cyanidioschyzon merolae strain 10D]BAM78917.1 similar to polyphosphoinositide binding protein Ssh2 [Cyanidioschyzon merolae strain 10D]|eukprot:XP_005535203.1 similar to polyphosphoinositide binding protein Ssh2 [Cyanidioschyzon merolae strain 10D]
MNFFGIFSNESARGRYHCDNATYDSVLNPQTGYPGCLTGAQADALSAFERQLVTEDVLPRRFRSDYNSQDLRTEDDAVDASADGDQLKPKACGHVDAMLAFMNHSLEHRRRVLLQFLRARDFRVDAAYALFTDTLLWRSRTQVCCIAREEIIKNPAACFPFTLVPGARNNYGHRLLYGKMVLFRKRDVNRDAFRAATIALLEHCCYAADAAAVDEHSSPFPHSQERFTVVFDLGHGFDVFHNAELGCYSDMIRLVQNHYPERLGKVYIIHYSRHIHIFYRLLSPFIEDKTRAKIHWVPESEIVPTFRHDFPNDSLPKSLGGELEWHI